MFQFQPFTQAELDADPRLAALAADKRAFVAELEAIVQTCPPSEALLSVEKLLQDQAWIERQREAAHLAAMQAENVRRGWKPATWREILGEPQYVPHEQSSELIDHASLRRASPDGCCHKTRRGGWPCPLGWKCPHDGKNASASDEPEAA